MAGPGEHNCGRRPTDAGIVDEGPKRLDFGALRDYSFAEFFFPRVEYFRGIINQLLQK